MPGEAEKHHWRAQFEEEHAAHASSFYDFVINILEARYGEPINDNCIEFVKMNTGFAVYVRSMERYSTP